MANRFWMSIKQAILNTSGFFSITSLQHKKHAQSRGQSGNSWPGLRAARLSGAQRSDLKGKRGFMHREFCCEAPGRAGSSPAASYEGHPAARRPEAV